MLDFSIWFLIWLGLFYLPRILLLGVGWINQNQFLATQPEKEWLVSGYKLFLILWLPLSVIGTARFFQEASTEIFYLHVGFIPLLGIGLVKGICESVFGISWFYGWRVLEKANPRFQAGSLRFIFLRTLDFHFARAKKRVQLVGLFRLVMNTAVLLTLIFMF